MDVSRETRVSRFWAGVSPRTSEPSRSPACEGVAGVESSELFQGGGDSSPPCRPTSADPETALRQPAHGKSPDLAGSPRRVETGPSLLFDQHAAAPACMFHVKHPLPQAMRRTATGALICPADTFHAAQPPAVHTGGTRLQARARLLPWARHWKRPRRGNARGVAADDEHLPYGTATPLCFT